MTMTFRIPTLALAALVAGCASSGHYAEQVPAIEVPAEYGRGDVQRSPSARSLPSPDTGRRSDVGDDPWWHEFGDARLDRMVDQALAANANLASAGFALRQARLEARLATNDLYPQASAAFEASRSRRVDGDDSTERDHAANVGVAWEIDLFGRLRAQRDVQGWRAQASAEDFRATVLVLVGDLCRNYWMLAYLNQSIRAGEQDLAALERILQLVEVQHAQGDVSRLEMREVQQSLESRRAAQSALTQQRVEVRNALATLLDGQPWPQNEEPQSLQAVSPLTVREGIPVELLGRRPDLRAAERRLHASLANIDATARSYYPALRLTGALGTSSSALSDVLKNPVAVLGVGLNLPFLNVGRMRTDTEIAGTAYLQNASAFRNTLYGALQEVDDRLSARVRLQAQFAARLRSYEAAKDVARLYEVRYREGASALRIWLDAQQVLRSSELALAQVARDQASNDVSLMLALGGS